MLLAALDLIKTARVADTLDFWKALNVSLTVLLENTLNQKPTLVKNVTLLAKLAKEKRPINVILVDQDHSSTAMNAKNPAQLANSETP